MVAAISINIQEPLFESQTKIKLGSLTTEPDGGISIDKFIGDFVKSQVDNFLHKNTDVAEVILQKVSESERERSTAVHAALGRLSPGDRALLYRKYYYLQSTAQIAAELGMTARAVEGRLYRLKKQMMLVHYGDSIIFLKMSI